MWWYGSKRTINGQTKGEVYLGFFVNSYLWVRNHVLYVFRLMESEVHFFFHKGFLSLREGLCYEGLCGWSFVE